MHDRIVCLVRKPNARDVLLMKWLNPLAQEGVILNLYEDPALLLDFCSDLTRSAIGDLNFESTLVRPYTGIKPSDVYWHLVDGDKVVPTAYIASYDGTTFSGITPVSGEYITAMVERLFESHKSEESEQVK